MPSIMINPNCDNFWLPYDTREGSQCGCCNAADAISASDVWQCQRFPERRWQLYPSAECGWDTVRRFQHPISACQGGNCEFHPLMRPEYRLNLGDQADLYEEWRAESETAAELEARLAAAAAERAAREIDAEAIKRECYARDVKERTMMGVRRGEAPKKLGLPCKWVIGEFKGDECWAYEYTDPKTGKRMCPHTCPRIHPGQTGWHNEWFNNRNWKPPQALPPPPPPPSAGAVRFAALSGAKPLDARLGAKSVAAAPPPPPPPRKAAPKNRFGVLEEDSDEGADAW